MTFSLVLLFDLKSFPLILMKQYIVPYRLCLLLYATSFCNWSWMNVIMVLDVSLVNKIYLSLLSTGTFSLFYLEWRLLYLDLIMIYSYVFLLSFVHLLSCLNFSFWLDWPPLSFLIFCLPNELKALTGSSVFFSWWPR